MESAETAQAIPIRNVWYLLLYAWDMARWKEQSPFESEPSPRLLGLLARVLAEATPTLLRRQLGRAHAPHSKTIRGIRGRIDFATSLKRATFRNGSIHCDFSERSIDTLKNRILHAT